MSIFYGQTDFTLAAGRSIFVNTRFGGDDNSGGDYKGPIVVLAIPEELRQRLIISTVDVEFTVRNPDGLSSKCFYHYTVTNNNSFPVTFRVDKFVN